VKDLCKQGNKRISSPSNYKHFDEGPEAYRRVTVVICFASYRTKITTENFKRRST